MKARVLQGARATIKVGDKTVAVGGYGGAGSTGGSSSGGAGGSGRIVMVDYVFKAEKKHHVCFDCGYPAKTEDELAVHGWMCTTNSSDRLRSEFHASEIDRLAAIHYLQRGAGESDADLRARIKKHLLESHAQRIR